MFLMNCFFRWGWLLGIALIIPISLPARGCEINSYEIRRGLINNQFLASDSCLLRSSPFVIAPINRTIPVGTPVRVIREWTNIDGQSWLLVELSSDMPQGPTRGWVNV
tara:strand:+ start:984 stop:1307 length:324 start_codon:yes stop_codon:yes gene_type:complete